MRHFANVQIYQAATMDGRHSMEHLKKQVKVNTHVVLMTCLISTCETTDIQSLEVMFWQVFVNMGEGMGGTSDLWFFLGG